MVAEQMRELDENPAALILEPRPETRFPPWPWPLCTSVQNPDALLLIRRRSSHHGQDGLSRGRGRGCNHARRTSGHVRHRARLQKQVTATSCRRLLPPAPDAGFNGSWKSRTRPRPRSTCARQYFWNLACSCSAHAVLTEMERFVPKWWMLTGKSDRAVGDLDFLRLTGTPLPLVLRIPSTMRSWNAPSGRHGALSCGWSDLGSWDALWEAAPRTNGNVTQGDVPAHVHNSFLHAKPACWPPSVENHIV